MKRVFLVILDSLGIGEAPDAPDYYDEGSNTLKALTASPNLSIPNLSKLGLFNIDGAHHRPIQVEPLGQYARLQESSIGKDTVTGHWEMSGIISTSLRPIFSKGFPRSFVTKLEKATGKKFICNKQYSGTEVIKDYGCEHLKTGKLILYTSVDSVLQIACHKDVMPLQELYSVCRTVRELCKGKYAVGRVIARPFSGEYPNFFRTAGRHDYALNPPTPNLLTELENAGKDTYAIGKINDIFCGKSISKAIPTSNNNDGILHLMSAQNENFNGLCWINLCDFDSVFGHRNDVEGYAKALSEFDVYLGKFIAAMNDEDALIITADHGCDPSTPSTNHSREFVPFILYYRGITPANFGTVKGFNSVGKTVLSLLDIKAQTKTLT